MENSEKYTLSQVSSIIRFPNLGRNRIYYILKELEIVDSKNIPFSKYIRDGLLDYTVTERWVNSRIVEVAVTLVVGQRGLDFIEKTINDYLKVNPLPKIKRKKDRNHLPSI